MTNQKKNRFKYGVLNKYGVLKTYINGNFRRNLSKRQPNHVGDPKNKTRSSSYYDILVHSAPSFYLTQ